MNKNFRVANGEAWAIKKNALEKLIALAKAQTGDMGIAPQYSSPNKNSSNIAVININGTIFRYDNIFINWFGGSSVESITNDLDEALADSSVSAILLDINSPGGSVDGISELSTKIYNARGIKPIYAYVGGEACSAGYWIGSSADKIIVSETGIVGSIGVYATYFDYTKAKDDAGIKEITIVSSLSPNKVPDPAEDKGKAQLQAHIDTFANIFVESVARNRGVTKDEVLANYGQGDIMIGKNAVEKGMADKVGTYEMTIEFLEKLGGKKKMTIDELKSQSPELFAEIMNMGALAERQRIQALEELANAETSEILAKVKFDGRTTKADAALLILEANREKLEKIKVSRVNDAEEIPALEIGTEIKAEDKAVQTLVASAKNINGGK